jgi:hypothetical protein
MSIQKKPLSIKKSAVPTPVNKKSSVKSKMDTTKPAASRVISAMRIT